MKFVSFGEKLSFLVITLYLGVLLPLGACAFSKVPKKTFNTICSITMKNFPTNYPMSTSASHERVFRGDSSFAAPIGGYSPQAEQRKGFSFSTQTRNNKVDLTKLKQHFKNIMSGLSKPGLHFASTTTTFRNLGDTIKKTYKLTTDAQSYIDLMNLYLDNLTAQLKNAHISVPAIVLDSAKYRLADIPRETDRIRENCSSPEMCENDLESLLRDKYWNILTAEIPEELVKLEKMFNSIGIGKKQIPSGYLTNYTSNEPLNKVLSIHKEIQDLVQSGQIKGQVGEILSGVERKNLEGWRSWAKYTGDMSSQAIQGPVVEPVD